MVKWNSADIKIDFFVFVVDCRTNIFLIAKNMFYGHCTVKIIPPIDSIIKALLFVESVFFNSLGNGFNQQIPVGYSVDKICVAVPKMVLLSVPFVGIPKPF